MYSAGEENRVSNLSLILLYDNSGFTWLTPPPLQKCVHKICVALHRFENALCYVDVAALPPPTGDMGQPVDPTYFTT